MLYLAADHRGFSLKETIGKYLEDHNIPYEDIGALSFDSEDDYSRYAKLLAHKILENPDLHTGIACCGSGAGMSIVLNRFRGIRAGLCTDPSMVKAQREQDNINVVVFPANFITSQAVPSSIDVFCHTAFLQEERYIRRITDIDR